MGTKRRKSSAIRVGLRALKNETSAIVARVREGAIATITDRGRPVAVIMPVVDDDLDARLAALGKTGRISCGGKPWSARTLIDAPNAKLAEAVIEDRR